MTPRVAAAPVSYGVFEITVGRTDLPDGQTVRCRVVNVKDDGTIQVVPEHAVVMR